MLTPNHGKVMIMVYKRNAPATLEASRGRHRIWRIAVQHKSIPPLTPQQETSFWNRVEVNHPANCWLWSGYRNTRGYGYYNLTNVGLVAAYRVSYSILIGSIPNEMTLDHMCRNRACVNPDHLQVVTHRENSRRGYGPSGVNAKKTHCNYGHPFTPENTYHPKLRPTSRVCRECTRMRSKSRSAVQS